MTSKENAESPITIYTLLSEAHAECEADRQFSLRAAHDRFDRAWCNCTRPTTGSQPSFEFFGDWIARKMGMVKCEHGRWGQSSLDCWHIVGTLFPDDREAYSRFWTLLEEFCRLGEVVVASFDGGHPAEALGLPHRCELRRMNPEAGVYARCRFTDDDRVFGIRTVNFGFFDSAETAKTVVESEAKVPIAAWRPATEV